MFLFDLYISKKIMLNKSYDEGNRKRTLNRKFLLIFLLHILDNYSFHYILLTCYYSIFLPRKKTKAESTLGERKSAFFIIFPETHLPAK